MTETPEIKHDLAKAYEAAKVEGKWYRFWLEKGYFTPKIDKQKSPFVIIMPPPNVTGELHIGHALTDTLEDIMVRWHRMKGEPALWLPGFDHAGIATQVVVERLLASEGTDRHRLGREKFIERVREWALKYRSRIREQHQRLGASCDWNRERFTMDEGPSLAVRTAFVRLYQKGLVYRGERIINWCPRCATALSDLEVNHKETGGQLYYVRYHLDGNDDFITVATTRPETILGDTAVAVNPGDDRYRSVVGKKAIIPFVNRIVPIIADEAVDPVFGTGAVKVTPAHDPVDFEIASKHELPSVNILNPDATMNENAGSYQGLDRFAGRKKILTDLEKEGLLVKTEPYSHAIGHCDRCQVVIEPIASKQWFIRMMPLAEPAINAVVDGRIRILPERFTKIYLDWLQNIRDWCISRQLWWGHRIPAWYCGKCDGDKIYLKLAARLTNRYQMAPAIYQYSLLNGLGPSHKEIIDNIEWASIDISAVPIVELDRPEECTKCHSRDLIPDPDVLDTWFSSALWPHSTLGWPEDTEDLQYFYPTMVMETGYDILFFWVARMVMMGLEDTGNIPFHTVYLHGLIRDENGEKMSKVRGNVVNPIDTLEKYGTDALRFSLSTGTAPGNDIKLSPSRLEAGRNFANKLWNAARFVISSIEPATEMRIQPERLLLEDRWILSRLNQTVAGVNDSMNQYQFGEAQKQIHDFLWGEFCDWYIEIAKIRLRHKKAISPLPILAHVLEVALRLLHPYMPFVTEELWQHLKEHLPSDNKNPDSIMVAKYPQAGEEISDKEAEKTMALVIEIVHAIRNARAEHRVDTGRWISAQIYAGGLTATIKDYFEVIQNLARVKPVTFSDNRREKKSSENDLVLLLKEIDIVIPMSSMLDLKLEQERLSKEITGCQAQIKRLEARLNNQNFLNKAPDAVITRERERAVTLSNRLVRLKEEVNKLN